MTLFVLVALVGAVELTALVWVLSLLAWRREDGRARLDFRPEVLAEERALGPGPEPIELPRRPLAMPGAEARWLLGPREPGG
jgi:hypothetical protein